MSNVQLHPLVDTVIDILHDQNKVVYVVEYRVLGHVAMGVQAVFDSQEEAIKYCMNPDHCLNRNKERKDYELEWANTSSKDEDAIRNLAGWFIYKMTINRDKLY